MMKKYNFSIWFWLFLLALTIISISFLALFIRNKDISFGATLSPHYSEELGFEVEEILRMAYFELGLRNFRIPVHWWRYEAFEGDYKFEELDSIIKFAEDHGLHITLAIGQKVPRWPECFSPDWTDEYSQQDFELAKIEFLKQVLARYSDSKAIRRWQVENEPYFPFGECRQIRPEFVKLQKDIVRSIITDRPIQSTTSGEQAIWALKAGQADIVGASLYRTVSNPVIGYFTFPHSPLWYRAQATLVSLIGARPIISELQAEPWGVYEFDFDAEDFAQKGINAFPPSRLEEQVDFAINTGIREIYFWGIEWWYLLRSKGDSSLWWKASELINRYDR